MTKKTHFLWIGLTAIALLVVGCDQQAPTSFDEPSEQLSKKALPPLVTPQQIVGGPVVLMGIDAEDGGPGAHGPITVYESVLTNGSNTGILDNVTNGGSGILVIGGGKSAFDGPTTFWNQIATDLSVTVTFVNGATNITNQSFAGFAMIVVGSDVFNTPSGGLTSAENTALTGRASAIANFVNGGGGLLGFASSGFGTAAYGYLGFVGTFIVNFPAQYADITPTTAGLNIGITNALDVCCWHDEYITFPSFLGILATNATTTTGNAAAIGGAQVEFPSEVVCDIKPGSDPNSINIKNNGTIPVAILTTSTAAGDAVDFDATLVDPSTVVFGPGGTSTAHNVANNLALHQQDVDGDSDTDLVLHFDRQLSGIQAGDTQACLFGEETATGDAFFCCDDIRVLEPTRKPKPTLKGKLKSIDLFINHTDCTGLPGPPTGQFKFQLNGVDLGSAGTTEVCSCNSNEQQVTFNDSDAWNHIGGNTLTVEVVGNLVLIGYIRATIETSASTATVAVFDATGGDASNRDLCLGFVISSTQNIFEIDLN